MHLNSINSEDSCQFPTFFCLKANIFEQVLINSGNSIVELVSIDKAVQTNSRFEISIAKNNLALSSFFNLLSSIYI